MKKTWLTLLAILCCGSLTLSASACGRNNSSMSTESTSSISESNNNGSSSSSNGDDSSSGGDNDSSSNGDDENQHTHEFGAWTYTETERTRFCACGEKETLAHTYDGKNTCTACGVISVGTEGLEYLSLDDAPAYTVIGMGTATDTDIVIPSFYNGKPVLSVGYPEYNSFLSSGFANRADLTSVTIGNGVTSIGVATFCNCVGLTSVSFPNSLYSVVSSSFEGCNELIQTEGGVSYVNDWAIDCDDSVSSVSLRDDTKGIAAMAFAECPSLTNITFPDSLYYIGNTAFYNCTGLTNVTLPEKVVSIGAWAFQSCTGLTSINIPDSVISVGEHAFLDCDAIVQTEKGVSYVDKWVVSHDALTSVELRADTRGLAGWAFANGAFESIALPKGILSIGTEAFLDCDNLTNITLPDGVLSIEKAAFIGCDNLESISIPDSVSYIAAGVFGSCKNLTSVTVDEKNSVYQSIDGNLYSKDGKTLLCYAKGKTATEFTIPDSVTTIGFSSFSSCGNLKSVTIPNGVTAIEKFAFSGCNALTSITIPASVTFIENNAFSCPKLIEVINQSTLPIAAGDRSCGDVGYYAKNVLNETPTVSNFIQENDYLFYKHDGNYYLLGYEGNDTELILPNDVHGAHYEIYQYAFYNRDTLTSVTFSKGITAIGNYAFYDCVALTDINIPNGVVSIGDSAFARCKFLNISIPDSVITLGNDAFWACSRLTNVTIGSGLSSPISPRTFSGSALQTFTVSEENTFYASQDGILYNKAKTEIVIVPHGISGTVTLADSLTCVTRITFVNCPSLTEIVIPDSVTSIELSAFDCRNLTSVYYKGDETAWNLISISNGNSSLLSATRYYYSETQPVDEGNYWRYVDGVPTPW